MILRKTFIILIWLLGVQFGLSGQDPFFSQPYSNLVYLNPAYAGTANIRRISAGYRNQIPAMGSVYVSYNASYDQPVKLLQGGMGINIMNDVQGNGTMNRLGIDAMYSYQLKVTPDFTINAGFQVSWIQRFLNTKDMIFTDPGESISDMSRGYPDFAVGFIGYTRYLYGGVAVHHLTRPNMSFSKSELQKLPRRYSAHFGAYIPIYEKRFGREALRLNPNILYSYQSEHRRLDYGMDVIYKILTAGVWLRHQGNFNLSSISFMAAYDLPGFRIGYSYDFIISDPWKNMSNMGAHEVTFLLKLEYKTSQRMKSGTIISPRI